MLTRIATFIAKKLLANGLIEEDDTDLYVYGLEVLISTICSFLTVLLLGIVLSEIITALIYLAVLIIIRRFTGGYHARTYIGCNLSCCVIFIVSLYISKAVYFNLIPTIIIHSVGMILIVAFSPVENQNKPLSQKKRKRNKRLSILSCAILSTLSICLSAYGLPYSTILTVSYVDVLILMVCGHIINRRREVKMNEKAV
ncbi:MAG: accessory gene regulator B family protein [Clostridia bacterium]|nr:accessory gene regulator B family protein [Clostridia bacterium]